jgi:hypothetical protein
MASIQCRVGSGTSIRFWLDPWLNGRSIEQLAPELFAALMGRQWRRRTVAEALVNNAWINDIRGALTIPVLSKYLHLCVEVNSITLGPTVPDSTVWRWDPSGKYSASSAYQTLFLGQHTLEGAKELWKVHAPGKCKMFLWLLMHEMVWTSERLQRHGMENHGPCALCC